MFGFNPRALHLRSVVETVEVEQLFSEYFVFPLSALSNQQAMLTHLLMMLYNLIN